MKKLKICLVSIIAVFSTFGIFAKNPIIANAGKSPVYVDSSSYAGGFVTGEWEVSSDVAKASGVNIIFPWNSTIESKAVNNNKFSVMRNTDKFLEVIADLRINSIAEGKRFGVAFGLNYYVSKLSNGKCSFVWFEKDGKNGLKVGVSSVAAGAKMTDLFVSTVPVAHIGELISMSLNVSTEKKCSLFIGETCVIENIEGLTYLDGYCGFMQTGGVSVEVEGLSLSGYSNDTPTNVDFRESFDYSDFNAALLYSSAAVSEFNPKGKIAVEDKKLVWQDVTDGYLSTKHKYSNVDMSFDLYLDNQFIEDHNGVSRKQVSAGFSFVFGAQDYKDNTVVPVQVSLEPFSENKLQSSVETVVSVGGASVENPVQVTLPEELNIFNNITEEGAFVSVWVRVIDGQAELYLKYNFDQYFTKVLDVAIGNTPLGYTQIVSSGTVSKMCNFAIDNLSVANFDINRKTDAYMYRTSNWDMSDYLYNDTWDDSDLIG